MCPAVVTWLTSACLIDKTGIKSPALETVDSYYPEEWRPADQSEQGLYVRVAGDKRGKAGHRMKYAHCQRDENNRLQLGGKRLRFRAGKLAFLNGCSGFGIDSAR
jgi:hypothetical protein